MSYSNNDSFEISKTHTTKPVLINFKNDTNNNSFVTLKRYTGVDNEANNLESILKTAIESMLLSMIDTNSITQDKEDGSNSPRATALNTPSQSKIPNRSVGALRKVRMQRRTP